MIGLLLLLPERRHLEDLAPAIPPSSRDAIELGLLPGASLQVDDVPVRIDRRFTRADAVKALVEAGGVAERRLARVLKVHPLLVAVAARRRFRMSLTEKRNELAGPGTDHKNHDAMVRARVTFDRLRPEIEKEIESMRRKGN